MLEIIVVRAANKATIITCQLLIEHWHNWISDVTIAGAMLNRLMPHDTFHPDGRVSELNRSKLVSKKPKTERS